PVPKFISVQGHRVMVDYHGLRRVCNRSHKEGHIEPACKTPHCDRYGIFDPATEGCTASCLRCGHAHATTDCTQRESYAAATLQPEDTRSSSPSRAAATQEPQSPSQHMNGRDDPGRLPFNRLRLCILTAPDALEDSESSAPSSTAAAFGSPVAETDYYSSDSDRLIIDDAGDATPGQGVSSSAATTSETTASSESSTDSSSFDDATMPLDRSDVKRGFSASKSSTDTAPNLSLVLTRRPLRRTMH
ncbi:hypothetical protein HPB47_015967, partial [Ixodes persulcatus]